MENNIKNNVCKFLIAVFVISIITSMVVFLDTKEDYISEKADVAEQKINALRSGFWNYDPDVDTSELYEIVLKRNICIGCIIICVIGVVICCIILFYKPNKLIKIITKSQHTSYSIESALQDLERIYQNNLITQEEYESKRKEILRRL